MSVKPNAQKVRQLRKELMWSQEDLAEGSGLSLRTIQRIERSTLVSIDTLKALAAAFNITADELVLPAGLTGLRIGTLLGFAGAIIGAAFGINGVLTEASQGLISGQEAGVWAGSIGAIAGLICAFIGYFSYRIEQGAPRT